MSTLVMTFGRFSPITLGHEKVVKKMIRLAEKNRADIGIFISKTYDVGKNPIPYKMKTKLAKIAFGEDLVKDYQGRTLPNLIDELKARYDNLIVVVGQDRVDDFRKFFENNLSFDSVRVVNAGRRDPSAEGVEGISGSKMRNYAQRGDFESFDAGMIKKLKPYSRKIFDVIRNNSPSIVSKT